MFPMERFRYPRVPTVLDDREKTFQLSNSSSWLSVGLQSTCGERKYELSNPDLVLKYLGVRAGKQSSEEGKDEISKKRLGKSVIQSKSSTTPESSKKYIIDNLKI